MKKTKYIKPLVSLFPYQDCISFAAASDGKKANQDYKINALTPKTDIDPNDREDYDPGW